MHVQNSICYFDFRKRMTCTEDCLMWVLIINTSQITSEIHWTGTDKQCSLWSTACFVVYPLPQISRSRRAATMDQKRTILSGIQTYATQKAKLCSICHLHQVLAQHKVIWEAQVPFYISTVSWKNKAFQNWLALYSSSVVATSGMSIWLLITALFTNLQGWKWQTSVSLDAWIVAQKSSDYLSSKIHLFLMT